MDRDLFLLLAGAGISLATTIVTLIANFSLNQLAEKRREERSVARKKQEDIHAALTSKEMPIGAGLLTSRDRLAKHTRLYFTKRILEENKTQGDAVRVRLRGLRNRSILDEVGPMADRSDETHRFVLGGRLESIRREILGKSRISIEGNEMSNLLRNIEKEIHTKHIDEP